MIFQTRDNSKALTVSGNASGMTGTVYAPAAQLAESGNTQLDAAVIVDTMTVSGNGIAHTLALAAPSGTVAYTPTQIRAAYGISKLSLDGTGQTIAIVDAYDDPSIYQALDAFDSQFGLVVVLDRAQPVSVISNWTPASNPMTKRLTAPMAGGTVSLGIGGARILPAMNVGTRSPVFPAGILNALVAGSFDIPLLFADTGQRNPSHKVRTRLRRSLVSWYVRY